MGAIDSADKKPVTARDVIKNSGSDPDQKWWDGLDASQRAAALARTLQVQAQRFSANPETMSIGGRSKDSLFVAVRMPHDDPGEDYYEDTQRHPGAYDVDLKRSSLIVARFHFYPSSAIAEPVIAGEALLYYTAADLPYLKRTHTNLPSGVYIEKRAESFFNLLDPKKAASNLSSPESEEKIVESPRGPIVPGSQSEEWERAWLHPLSAIARPEGIGSRNSFISEVRAGQYFCVHFSSSTGEVTGIQVGDFIGTVESGAPMTSRGIQVFKNPLGDYRSLNFGVETTTEFTFSTDPITGELSISRKVGDETVELLKAPAKLNPERGIKSLIHPNALNSPDDTPSDDDLFMDRSIFAAHGVKTTPHSSERMQTLQEGKELSMKDPEDSTDQ